GSLHQLTNFPCKAHKCASGVSDASVSTPTAHNIGASLRHSRIAWASANQSGGSGAESSRRNGTTVPLARSGLALPVKAFMLSFLFLVIGFLDISARYKKLTVQKSLRSEERRVG